MDTSIVIFIITLIFMSFYIFNEARPEGSKFSETIRDTLKRFLEKIMLSINSCRVRRFTLIVAVILVAVVGSMASTSAGTDSWYLLLNKSELNPPSYVFGIVWPILYILMMVSAFLAHKNIFSIFIIQLIFNAAWSWLFFRFQMPLIALLDIYLLIAINIYILNLMYKENKLAFFYLSLTFLDIFCELPKLIYCYK